MVLFLRSDSADSTSAEKKTPDKAEEEEGPSPVPVGQLFRYADRKDRWLISAGLLSAVLSSIALPVIIVIFGNVTEAMAEFGLNQTADGSAE